MYVSYPHRLLSDTSSMMSAPLKILLAVADTRFLLNSLTSFNTSGGYW